MSALLELRGLSKQYGERIALSEATLSIEAGTVWGLIGENGAGKSTLLRLVGALQRPCAGEIRFRGEAIDQLGPGYRREVGYASEKPSLYARWSVRENLAFFGRLRGLSERCAEELPASLEIDPLLERRAGELSRGQLQRAAIAVALLGRPKLLLLDEPHGGLDLEMLERVSAVIGGHAAQGGAVLLTSHVLSEVASSCSHIAVMHAGRLLASGPAAELARRASEGEAVPLPALYRTLVTRWTSAPLPQ